MYNVKIIKYLNNTEVVFYDRPIHNHEKDEKYCIIHKDDGFGYEIDKNDLFLCENLKFLHDKKGTERYNDIYHSLSVSRNRTKQKIYNYARANYWEWFFTFTFNPKKVDSYDYDEVIVVMSDWLNYMYHHNKTGNLKYLIVPEQHKSGAWHFHGIFSGLDYDLWRLMFSGKYDKCKPIYNVLSFPYGFTTVTEVTNTKAVSHYICKYVTKNLLDTIKNKKRYWVTKNCASGDVQTYMFSKKELEILLNSFGEPDFKKSINTPYNDIIYMQYDF